MRLMECDRCNAHSGRWVTMSFTQWRKKGRPTKRCTTFDFFSIHSIRRPFNCFCFWVCAVHSFDSASDAAFIPNTTEHSRKMLRIWRVNWVELTATTYVCCHAVVWSHISLKKLCARMDMVGCRMPACNSIASQYVQTNIILLGGDWWARAM